MYQPPKIRQSWSAMYLGKTQYGSTPQHHYCWNWHNDALLTSYTNGRVNGHWNGGGPFFLCKESRTHNPTAPFMEDATWSSQVYNHSCQVPDGSLYQRPGWSPPGKPASSAPNWTSLQNSLFTKGATGYRLARPGNPVAGALNFAAELRDLPHLPGKMLARAKKFNSLGKEYLNAEFGWKPFVSDMRKMYELYRNLDKHLNQLVRDNGRIIRRRRELGGSTNTSAVIWQSNDISRIQPGSIDPAWGHTYRTEITTTTDRSWFVGAFQYYIPDIGSDQWRGRAVKALYGANVTPAVLWEATPWSWLLDYFGNMGDLMSNLSTNAAEGVVGRYAYIMHNSTTVVDTTMVIDQGSSSSQTTHPKRTYTCSYIYRKEIKARVPSTPYGFGMSYDGLSDHQKGILAALGISRSKF